MNGEAFSTERFREYLSLLGDYPVLQAATVLAVSLLLAWLVDVIVSRLVLRLTARTQTRLDDVVVKLMHRPLFISVVMAGLAIAARLVAPSEHVGDVATNVIQTIVVVMWTLFGVRVATVLIQAAADDANHFHFIQQPTRALFETTATLALIAGGAYLILAAWGIDPIGWLATAGIAAVAVGLAAQDMLGNLFGGLQILADAPYKIGDYVVLESKERGRVTRIGLRSTRILMEDDIQITVPNSVIARSKLINETMGRGVEQRIAIPVGIAYGSDPAIVEKALLEALAGIDGICAEPRPWVKLAAFGPSALEFVLYCWIGEAAMRGRLVGTINRAVYAALNRHELQIPFPQQDVYVKELPEGFASRGPGGAS